MTYRVRDEQGDDDTEVVQEVDLPKMGDEAEGDELLDQGMLKRLVERLWHEWLRPGDN